MQKLLAVIICWCWLWPASAQPNITAAEYFIDTDPGFGNATSILITTPSPNLADQPFSVAIGSVPPGVHSLFVRSRDAGGKWSVTNRFVFFKVSAATGSTVSNITKAEYFFDTDPGFGSGTAIPLTPGADVQNISFAANIDPLPLGIHSLYIRSQDADGKWSITNRFILFKAATATGTAASDIVKAEYFFDADPGFGSAANIPLMPGTDVQNINFAADISTLSTGIHQFFLRSQSADGKWSITNRFVLYKPAPASTLPPANITQVEYFIDTNPAFGNAVPVAINPAPVLADFVMPVNISGLSVGNHRLYIRSRSQTGWSITNVYAFPIAATAPTPFINVNAITKTAMCVRDSVQLSFDARGSFNPGNVFNAELSDASGSFASPVVIGSYTGTNSAIINAILPNTIVGGTNFRVRVSGTNPVVTGLAGSNALTIGNKSAPQTITGQADVNGTFSYNYSIPAVTGSTWNWLVNGGTQQTGGNSNSIGITWAQPPSPVSTGNVKLVETNYGCTGDTSTLNLTIYKLRIGNTVATNACKGFGLTVNVNADGAYNSGNTYTAQLSNATGSFASPINIGSTAGVGNGVGQTTVINANLPFSLPNGTGYQVRIVSSNPAFTGDTSAAINITKPDIGTDITRSKCPGFGYNLQQNYTDATLTYVYYTQAFSSLSRPDSVDAGTYQVIATNSTGCKDTATITVTNYPKPDLGPDQSVSKCPGETVNMNSLFNLFALNTIWTTTTPPSQVIPAAQLQPGTFRLIVTNSNGCRDTAFVTVSNYPKPDVGPDKTVTIACAGDAYDLTTVFTTTGLTTTWSTVTPTTALAGIYQLIVTSANGCKDTASVTVNPAPIATVPTVANTKTANRECTTADGWTHYYFDNNTPADFNDDIRLLSLKKNGQNIGTVGNGSFEVKVAATAGAGSNTAVQVSSPLIPNNNYWTMNRYWSVTPTQQPTANIGVRFYYNTQDLADVNGSFPGVPVSHTGLLLYKTDGNPDPTSNFAGATQLQSYTNGATPSLSVWAYTALGGMLHQAEFSVSNFSGGGAGAAQGGTLPVALLQFTAIRHQNKALLSWITSTESNSSHFVVERSLDGRTFAPVGQVTAAGNSYTNRAYLFTDNLTTINFQATAVYYRLQMVDKNGDAKTSRVASVKLVGHTNLLTLLGNPVRGEAMLQYQSTTAQKATLRIADASGKVALIKNIAVVIGANQYRLPVAALAKGIYTVELTAGEEQNMVRMIKE